MIGTEQQTQLTKVLAIGIFLVSVTVITEGLTDPVNVPKLFVLGVVSSSLLGMLINFKVKIFQLQEITTTSILILFAVCATIATVRSESPLTQNLYGTYGRNNGLIAYIFLIMLLFVTACITNRSNQTKILKSLIYVGYLNLAYCLWVILFGDFIPWTNPYGNILGTFGNPNFIGAFLGMFFGVLLAIGLGKDISSKSKIGLVFLLPLTLFEIVESNAIQGRVLALLSIGIIGLFYLYFKISKLFAFFYLIVCLVLGGFALAGAFQRGPLTELIYKTSVSLRGQYWLAAWNTGKENPLSGAGMDAFGDWYRRSRDIRAIELPGINTVVNTAHNVPLDMFAFGGWPLLVSYLLVIAITLKSVLKIIRNMKDYDSVGVGLITAWTCYQTQSIISINQIGLAIWGWVLSGSLIAYSKSLPPEENSKQLRKIKTSPTTLKPSVLLSASLFGLGGLLVSIPPLSADAKLRSAQMSQNANLLEQTMVSGYFNPQNSQKFALNVQALESSGLFELSHKYALEAVKWNPEAYELWRILYLIRNSSDAEKRLAIQNMKRLDPLNPDVTVKE